MAQGAMGGIVHDQIRSIVFDAKLQNMDNVRMPEPGNGASLGDKALLIGLAQLCLEYLDRGLRFKMFVNAQVDLGETTGAQHSGQRIIAKLFAEELANLLSHIVPTPFAVK